VHRRRTTPVSSQFRLVLGDAESNPVPALTDEALVDAVRRKDDQVATEIYDRLFGSIDQTLFRMLGQRGHEHDDLVQQAFEQVVLTLSRHAFAQMCSLKTWASRVATNVALNALRAKRRERAVFDKTWEIDEDAGPPSGRDLQHTLDSRADLARVREILAEMRHDRVEVLLLHDVMGHDLAEIALMVGISMPAAQSRLFRGRRELRERLAEAGLGAEGSEW
jgi:RNA polymerase sigma-70 factor (ECF subfamily)